MCDEQGDATGKIKHLRRVVEMDPENPEYKNGLGYELAMRGQSLDKAEQLLREAITLALR